MARRVFFSFHYENAIWRVSQIRNSWFLKPKREAAGFWDAAAWESVQRQGPGAVKRWIDTQLDGSSVTVVLIGSETASRPYVRYEIDRSREKGNGMLGIYIHNMKDQNGRTSLQGANPFVGNGLQSLLTCPYFVYDWVQHDGYNNMGAWIEAAAIKAGR